MTRPLTPFARSEPATADLARQALTSARRRNLTIVTAESCTAGLLAALLSEAPGAADQLHGGFVAYTKANKAKTLGVSEELLRRRGAVCGEVALAMAKGALERSPATLAVAITGVAGPEPDEDGNPVGRVCIAVAGAGRPARAVERDYGDLGRDEVRACAMADALTELIRLAEAD